MNAAQGRRLTKKLKQIFLTSITGIVIFSLAFPPSVFAQITNEPLQIAPEPIKEPAFTIPNEPPVPPPSEDIGTSPDGNDSIITEPAPDPGRGSGKTGETSKPKEGIDSRPKEIPDGPEKLKDKKDDKIQPESADDPPYRVVQPDGVIKQPRPDVDLSSGALVYKYPFKLPPGRNGLTPELSLIYNSQDRKEGSIIGLGWSLDIPYIQRENRYGNDAMYDVDLESFSSSLDGPLASTTVLNKYTAKTENGSFNKYTLVHEFIENAWKVDSKDGKTYWFGTTTNARIHFPDATSSAYMWMLDKVVDTNGNEINYTYTKDGEQVYIEKIEYMYADPEDSESSPLFSINFTWQARGDVFKSYLPGYELKTANNLQFIDIKENNALIRRYNFNYSTKGGIRSLLESVTEIGDPYNIGEGTITLPKTSFSYTPNNLSFASTTGDTDLDNLIFQEGVVVADVNSDGYADVLQSYRLESPSNDEQHVWLNNGDATFTEATTTWQIPDIDGTSDPVLICKQPDHSQPCNAQGAIVFNVEGNLLTDFVQSLPPAPDSSRMYLNTGGGWSHDSAWDETIDTLDPISINRPTVADLNGDGLVDYLAITDTGGIVAYRNTGSTIYGNGLGMGSNIPDQSGLRAVDLNNDGLSDIYRAYEDSESNYERKVFLNQSVWDGGFIEHTDWISLPQGESLVLEHFDTGTTRMFFADLNGDNLPEIISDDGKVYIHKWNYWTLSSVQLGVNVASTTRQVGDVNGDGLLDVFYNLCNPTCFTDVFENTSNVPDMLSAIKLPSGGIINAEYQASPQYKDENDYLLNPDLPITVQTVKAIGQFDPVTGSVGTTTYEYAGGDYYFDDPHDRRFSGFEKVTETRPDGSQKISYFHQGNGTNSSTYEFADHWAKIGKVFRTDILDSEENLVSQSGTKWSINGVPAVDPSYFVYPIQTVSAQYDGNGTHKDNAISYSFDFDYGNLTTERNWGEVTVTDPLNYTDVGSDDIRTNYEYATSTEIHRVSKETVLDSSSVTVSETKTIYDNLSFGEINQGNPTKKEYLISGSTYASTTHAYNSFGLLLSEQDPNSNETTYGYDSFNLYPETITNTLNQDTDYLYDYSSGKSKQVTNPNGEVRKNILDSLDRTTQEKGPDPNSGSEVTLRAITYIDEQNQNAVMATTSLSASLTTEEAQYLDGFGRPIQTRKQAEDTNTYIVQDIAYDPQGRTQRESLPYFGTGLSKSTATTTENLYTKYIYDTLDRVTEVGTAVGTTTTFYDDRVETVTDSLGNQKQFTRNAFNRLTYVTEYLDSDQATTTYEWNEISNLTKITDANGNVRNFEYDKLGRRTRMEDLHDPTDSYYGSTTFAYDFASNLTEKITPIGDTVSYAYDELNRPLEEDSDSTTETDIIYEYDSCTRGIGRLCYATSSLYATINNYDFAGNLANETKTIGTTTAATVYTYGYMGNPLTIKNPNGSLTAYTYNQGGNVETVAWHPSGGATTTLVSDIDYSPTGDTTAQTNANGTTKTNTYDANELYRLREQSIATSTPAIDRRIYDYDPVGNITHIVIESDVNPSINRIAEYDYDTLYRLASSTIVASTTANSYFEVFTYDEIGNIATSTGTDYYYEGNTGTSMANPHAVTSVGNNSFTYDTNGNQLTKGTSVSHAWDYNNRLTKITYPATQFPGFGEGPSFYKNATYGYDPSGTRIWSKPHGTATTTYVSPYFNVTENNATTTEHVIANGTPIATIETVGGTPTIRYPYIDHLQSTSLVTDSSGNTVEQIEYESYGTIVNRSGSFKEQQKYTGHELDDYIPYTEYTYAKARYLNTDIARFLSQDPEILNNPNQFLEDPQQLNTYAYARNNPLILVDRTGKKVELAARPALTGFFLHQFYIITPDFPNQINIQGLPAGTEQFTIGGYNRGGELFGRPFGIGNRLITEIGYEGGIENTDTPYLTGEKQVTDRTTITPPSGVSDAEFINNLGNAARTTLSQPYASGGSTFSFGGANSNNIVVSLAQRTGVVSQVTSFNPKNFNFSPGNQGYWIQSARQSIQARLNYISAQLEAIRQLLLTLR